MLSVPLNTGCAMPRAGSKQSISLSGVSCDLGGTLKPTALSADVTHVLAIDTESVECSLPQSEQAVSELARASIVNLFGQVILDELATPRSGLTVTDFRTPWSGLTHSDLFSNASRARFRSDALALKCLEVLNTCTCVVAHAARHDLEVLATPLGKTSYQLGIDNIRDTSRYFRYVDESRNSQKLKHLAKSVLGVSIQCGGGHSSVEDARAAMYLYRAVSEEWESLGSSAMLPHGKEAIDEAKMCIARVVHVPPETKWSEKLVPMTIDFGSGDQRTLVAPVKHYQPSELLDQKIVCCPNVKRHKPCGVYVNAVAILAQGRLLVAPNAQLREQVSTSERPVAQEAPNACKTSTWSTVGDRIFFSSEDGSARYSGISPMLQNVQLLTESTKSPVEQLVEQSSMQSRLTM